MASNYKHFYSFKMQKVMLEDMQINVMPNIHSSLIMDYATG